MAARSVGSSQQQGSGSSLRIKGGMGTVLSGILARGGAPATTASVPSPAAVDDDGDDIYRIDRDVLLTIARTTPLDVGLQRMVAQRPIAAELLADQIVFLTATIDKMRQTARIPKHVRPTAVDDLDTPSPVTSSAVHQPSVVLIGCGFIGGRVAERLLESRVIHPSSLHIMTRQPETLSRFAKAGALCGTLRPEEIAHADIVLVATLPGQLSGVTKHLKGNLKSSAVVVSLCAGVVAEKVCAETQHPLCLAAAVDTAATADIAAALGDAIHSTNLRRQCEASLLQNTLPKDAASAAEWLSRVAFVVANAGTAMGLPFHFAAFAAWSFLVSEACRMRFRGNYKDYVCPPPSDVQRMEFAHIVSFSERVGLGGPEVLIEAAREKMASMLRMFSVS